jgi:hypothetical protein
MIAPITAEQILATLADCRAKGDKGADVSFARLAYKHGNLTPEARQIAKEYAAKSNA